MSYPGGKEGGGSYQQIINQIPPHRVYIEAFFGAGSVYRYKRRAAVNIGIEVDPAVVSTICRRRDYGQVAVVDTAGSLETLSEQCRYGLEVYNDVLFLVIGDGVRFLESFDWQGDEYVYCDPPYLFGARRSQRNLYGCEFGTEEEHKLLLSTLLSLSPRGVNVGISGYDSPLYAAMLEDWRKVQWQVNTRGNRMATETLWMNYPEGPLHDYSYIGDNYRERERIAKKKIRWQRRLAKMPTLERLALIEAVNSFDADCTQSDAAGCSWLASFIPDVRGPGWKLETGGKEHGYFFSLEACIEYSTKQAKQGPPCPHCGRPREVNDKPCPHCGCDIL